MKEFKVKTFTETTVEGLMSSVSQTEQFLDFLRHIGKYDYRKKVHLSDIELTEFIDKQITNELAATREYFLMFSFLKREKLMESFGVFRTECLAEVQKRIGENKA